MTEFKKQPLKKYILINTLLESCYAYLSCGFLTEQEANIKNRAFLMNKSNKKYILQENWK